MWAPRLIRDIICKDGMECVNLEFALLDTYLERADAIKSLFDTKLAEWQMDNVTLYSTDDKAKALSNADFVIVAISTGRLETMQYDLQIPENYGIYHTVGDTSGPGGWSRALRNIPVIHDYAQMIKELAPNAFVLNLTNPMGALTKVLTNELGRRRVVGLCHALFECYEIFQAIFNLESERDIKVRFGGLNHFFWILDFAIKGEDGYKLLREKQQGRNFAELIDEVHRDAMGWSSDKWVTGELFKHYGYLPYIGDRHICEFFNCYITNKAVMEEFKLVRTTIEEREKMYLDAAENIRRWTNGEQADEELTRIPSREGVADIIRAVTFDEGYMDVMNMVNVGQVADLPMGAVVETMGYVDAGGFTPLAMGTMPEPLAGLILQHAKVQLATVEAGLDGNLDDAIIALAADPVCSHLSIGDIRKMGLEMLKANRQYLPQFDYMNGLLHQNNIPVPVLTSRL